MGSQSNAVAQSDSSNEDLLNGGKLFGQLTDKSRELFIEQFFAFAQTNIVDVRDTVIFDGAIDRACLDDIMRWICQRSDAGELVHLFDQLDENLAEHPALIKFRRDSFTRVGQAFVEVGSDDFKSQRLSVQLGGAENLSQLKRLLVLYANVKLISKLTEFTNVEREDVFERHFAGICSGMESIPSHLHALMMFQIARKTRTPLAFINGVVRAAGTSKPGVIAANGFGLPLRAMLAHADELVEQVQNVQGVFFDADFVCGKIERFHKISKAFMIAIDLPAKGDMIDQLHQQARRISQWIEPIVKNIAGQVIRALKLPKNEGQDSVDMEAILEAKSSMFVLETVRRCRDSLAINVLFSNAWKEVADILEPLTQRSLSYFRDHPTIDGPAHLRLDASIALAHLRFGDDFGRIYAEARDMIIAGQRGKNDA